MEFYSNPAIHVDLYYEPVITGITPVSIHVSKASDKYFDIYRSVVILVMFTLFFIYIVNMAGPTHILCNRKGLISL